MPHCRSPLHGDQTIGVTGGCVVDVVVLAAGAVVRAAGHRAWAAGGPWVAQPGRHQCGGQGDEEQGCSPRHHRAKRCTCLSGRDVTVLPAGHRGADDGATEPKRVEKGRAGASARAEYERRQVKDDARGGRCSGPFALRLGSSPVRTLHRSLARGAAGEELRRPLPGLRPAFHCRGSGRHLAPGVGQGAPGILAGRDRRRGAGLDARGSPPPYAPGGTSHRPTGASPRR